MEEESSSRKDTLIEILHRWESILGLNFINVLCTAFAWADPKSVKRYWWHNCIFYAFGIYKPKSCAVADPIKLLFFANEEFFCFLMVSLHVCYREKKSLLVKWPSL